MKSQRLRMCKNSICSNTTKEGHHCIREKSEKYNFREFEGITLISLVITIILLIILAGITINLSIGENGLFNKAKYAKEEYINSIEEEQKQINDAYGQMLVATGENATVTMTIKQLNDLIDERINSKLYVNTSKKIADITMNAEYQATEDCIIIGYVNGSNNSSINIMVDGITVMSFRNNNTAGVMVPIYVNLKAGQRIKFGSSGSNINVSAKAYATL